MISVAARGDRITREDIEAVATPELSAVVFRIAEAIGEKNYDKAAKVLGELYQMQKSPYEIMSALGKQLRQFGITTIYVTHDQLEAMALADRIAIMNGGIIEQVDTPAAIYSRPQTDFVAQFIGKINQLPGTVHKRGDQTVVDTGFVHLPYRGNREYREGDPVKVYLRLEDMALAAPGARGEGVIPAKVTQCIFMGACCQVGARIGESEVYFEAPPGSRHP